MLPMHRLSRQHHFPAWALAASLILHAIALFMPRQDPPLLLANTSVRATLRPQPPAISPTMPAELAPPPTATSHPAKRPRQMTARKSRGPVIAAQPRWSAAEKRKMDNFLEGLERQAKARPKPTLAQRSLAMARDYGREMAARDAAETVMLEPRPNAAPPDPFSLHMYVDNLIKRLNRSAEHVKKDPRSQGVRKAAIQFRVNPDGSLKSFVVLNAGDQAEEIAFIRSVIERSVPFAAFPPDINKAARSLAMTICIEPMSGGGGFGFTRLPEGRGC